MKTKISNAEYKIRKYLSGEENSPKIEEVRSSVSEAILSIYGKEDNEKELEDVLDEVISSENPDRNSILYISRILNVPDILKKGIDKDFQFSRRFSSSFERNIPELSSIIKIKESKQTIDKIKSIKDLYAQSIQILSPLSHISCVASVFLSSKQDIYKILNSKLLKSYFRPFCFNEKATIMKEIYILLEDLINCKDSTFSLKIEECEQKISSAEVVADGSYDIFTLEGYKPFISAARTVLTEIHTHSVERLHCYIRPKRPAPNVIERRFPLYESNREFKASIIFINEGPGLAIDTSVTVVTDDSSLSVKEDSLSIGSVEPGEFAVTFDFLVEEAVKEARLLVEVSWTTAQSTHRTTENFEVLLHSQDPNVAWEKLEKQDPYSTEVAYGDEFVGRRSKLTGLKARLLRARMQSSYITGQKRVGKTSLANAIKDHFSKENSLCQYIFIYLEYGDYAGSDASKTVTALGESIARELSTYLPFEMRNMSFDFNGTLAPLNQIANTLLTVEPEKRFIIILDEFDEIHPEMYRYGPLAEAFFSNLRTFSAKRNIAMMLVGGENMPFIISAQGDQLNKYVPEQLSYFSRSTEWEDYIDIVKLKNTSPLTWYESAINEIYRATNGHPYYTKLLCARIFQNSIQGRDTDITLDEVVGAIRILTDGLDTNSFAHFWKDGISSERAEAEITELKRKRVLVALGQTKRAAMLLTHDNILENIRNLSIESKEVPFILSDFVRRDILRENNGEYSFVLPLFEDWLVQHGVGKLISDTFGDDMAEALRLMEDEAFVTASEIATMLASWPPYRGKERGVGDIQAWLEQRSSFRERRLLFKFLQNLRFVREEEVRDKLRVAHNIVKQHMSAYTPENRSQRRFDILVTYVDGVGKSGAKFAEKYSEVNLISSTCIVEQENIINSINTINKTRDRPVSGIVIVDDVAATGSSLSKNLEKFIEKNNEYFSAHKLPIVVIALMATEEADLLVRKTLRKWKDIEIDFRVCEKINKDSFIFSDYSNIWNDHEERDRAKALALEIGNKISKKTPIGYGDMSLLLAFSDTVPNNTLTLIHSSCKEWRALLERPKN
ncbi:ATP-binding protein [Gluconobacter albidus]|uniref:ATP-binding protein n=1 Tax=Gluconobacter albidus TaxID=318683 RepID=UPI00209DEEA6|nr:ATP-binding protein [Gluconobacter albidus]MCP1274993.1 ATP-binding protein [Gluconobacter albidus]